MEDDPKLGPLVSRALGSDRHEVTLATSVDSARRAVGSFDLAVVDWMLPDGDGLELCGLLRRGEFAGPILMLTCRGETKDRVAALDLGVDDYLTKPFDMDELLARVRALGRRGKRLDGLDVGALHIDIWRRNVFAEGRLLPPLTAIELDLLVYLSQRPNQTVSKAELVGDVWDGHEVTSNLVQVAVSRLRDKLESHAWMIETVRGEGYRLRTTRARE